MGKLIILSGPSCMGKSPLVKALARFYPGLVEDWQPVVIYNSRQPRPGEEDGSDYHFRTWQQVEALRNDPRYIVRQVRNDLQAIDTLDLEDRLQNGDVFFEGNAIIASELRRQAGKLNADTVAVMLSPLSQDEIRELKEPQRNVDLAEFVKNVMLRKLLRRAHLQKPYLGLEDLRDLDKRAACAYDEMKFAPQFDAVIANHDGEDSDNWSAFYYPIGDARRTLHLFVDFINGTSDAAGLEHWNERLLP